MQKVDCCALQSIDVAKISPLKLLICRNTLQRAIVTVVSESEDSRKPVVTRTLKYLCFSSLLASLIPPISSQPGKKSWNHSCLDSIVSQEPEHFFAHRGVLTVLNALVPFLQHRVFPNTHHRCARSFYWWVGQILR